MRGRQCGTVAALLVVTCLACRSPGADRIQTERDLLRRIQTSETSQDHEALAAFYREQARAMEEKAEFHEGQAKRYARIPRGGRVGRIRSGALAASYRERAVEYEALATLHEGHARELRGQPK